MEITPTRLNKLQSKTVVKLMALLDKFIQAYEVSRKERPKQIALPSEVYKSLKGYYKDEPEKLSYMGIILYDQYHPPETKPCKDT